MVGVPPAIIAKRGITTEVERIKAIFSRNAGDDRELSCLPAMYTNV
jgi:hypothetical protein